MITTKYTKAPCSKYGRLKVVTDDDEMQLWYAKRIYFWSGVAVGIIVAVIVFLFAFSIGFGKR